MSFMALTLVSRMAAALVKTFVGISTNMTVVEALTQKFGANVGNGQWTSMDDAVVLAPTGPLPPYVGFTLFVA